MGLRLVAHFYDLGEALVAAAALEHAGVFCIVDNYNQLGVAPFRAVAYGGYRLLVVEQELADAVDILRDAMRNPLKEGERLHKQDFFIASLIATLLIGVPTPLRLYRWQSAA